MSYNEEDMRTAYRHGFWIGSVAGLVSMFVVCLLLGLYVYSG